MEAPNGTATMRAMGRRTSVVSIAALVGIVALAAAAAGPAGARAPKTWQVHPGGLRTTLAKANGGDTLVIHSGHYKGAIVVEKRLTLIGAKGEKRPRIDGLCDAQKTITVAHAGVLLQHLKVVGAGEGFGPFPSEVDFTGLPSGRAVDLVLHNTCNAEYGINVFTSERIDLLRNRASGFEDSGIYVGHIVSTGSGFLRVNGNETFNSNRGIIIENSAGGRLRVANNRMHDNKRSGLGVPDGLYINNSDGVVFSGNTIKDNGQHGIEISAGSDNNRFFDNVVAGNPGGNYLDEGSGNCGSGNHPNPFPSC
jgi:parallel beta-helix repeat protein